MKFSRLNYKRLVSEEWESGSGDVGLNEPVAGQITEVTSMETTTAREPTIPLEIDCNIYYNWSSIEWVYNRLSKMFLEN